MAERKQEELSLYVHIPFCVKKCNYCDFLSAPASEEKKEAYVRALCREIEREAACYPERRVRTVFFGGGTPTVLSAGQLNEILYKIRENFCMSSDFHGVIQGEREKEEDSGRDAGVVLSEKQKDSRIERYSAEPEITLECNPGTVRKEDLQSLREAGFNRLSIGLQSAQEEELKLLGRIHGWQDFLDTYLAAREAGFHNINVDIMSALPGQSVGSYQDMLQKVLALRPEHISAYSLIIEEGTPFYKQYAEADRQRQRDGEDRLHLLPTEGEERRMYELTGELLKRSGYHRYEISNYALPGRECRHNMVYWNRGNYLGLGLGAASLIDNCRFTNTGNLEEYLQQGHNSERSCLCHQDIQHLSVKEQMEEFMFLGLRLTEGISCTQFQECFRTSIEEIYGEVLRKLEAEKLLRRNGDRIMLTEWGTDVSNRVLAEFLLS